MAAVGNLTRVPQPRGEAVRIARLSEGSRSSPLEGLVFSQTSTKG